MMYAPLQAEEALLGAEIALAADSNVKHQQRQSVLDRWRRQANALTAKAKPTKREPMQREEFERMMATLGMSHG